MPVSRCLPFLARAVGVKPPHRVAAWVAKWAIGEGGVAMMTQVWTYTRNFIGPRFAAGYVTGYDDGTFRTDATDLTRSI